MPRLDTVCACAVVLGLVVLLGGAAAARADAAADRAAAAKAKQASKLAKSGDYAGALALADEGLKDAPAHLGLLQVRAATLLEMRDFEGALAAYEAFLAAGPKGANKRAAVKIVANLGSVRTTFVSITIAGASADKPATVYLDTKTLGAFCTAAPTCKRGILPGAYKLIVERPGHQKLTERFEVVAGSTYTLDKALVENDSSLTVSATAAGAVVLVDGQELGPAPQTTTIKPGEHAVEVRAAGHAAARQAVVGREGQPVELALTLTPLVGIAVNAEGAEVLLQGQPVPREGDGYVLPDGAVTLTVRAKGYRPANVEVPAERGVGHVVEVTLARAPAPVSVEGAPAGAVISIDGRVVGTAPLVKPVEVEQGAHSLEISAPGRRGFRRQLDVQSDAPLTVRVTAMPKTGRPKAWVATGVAGAGLVAAGVFGWMAFDKQTEFDDLAAQSGVAHDDARLATLKDDGETFSLLSDVSLGVALVGAGAATWFFLEEGKGESAGSVEPVVGVGVLGVRGSF